MGLRELFSGKSIADQAYEQREARVWPLIAPYVRGFEGFAQTERSKNFAANIKDFPRPEEVVSIQVMPTSDGGFTVGLIGADGRKCTFWIYCGDFPARKPQIDGANQCYRSNEITFPVDSITPY